MNAIRMANLSRLGRQGRRALFVLGMHRSGTSALTRALSLSGASLPRTLMDGNKDSNPLGHWEPSRIVDLHDRFLESVGSAWDDIKGLPAHIFDGEIAVEYRRRLVAVAREEYGDSAIFVLKDPRASRLMPLWRAVLAELGVEPLIVIALRNPLEVADSLIRRNGWDEHYAYVSWMRHMLAAERDTRGMRRRLTSYDQLLDDWRSVIRGINEELCPDEHYDIAEAAIDGFIRKDMRHHRRSTAELLARRDIADCVKETYQVFLDAVDSGWINGQALDQISRTLDRVESEFRILSPGDRRSLKALADSPQSHEERDALLALALAELGRLRLSGERLERRLHEVTAAHEHALQNSANEITEAHKLELRRLEAENERRLQETLAEAKAASAFELKRLAIDSDRRLREALDVQFRELQDLAELRERAHILELQRIDTAHDQRRQEALDAQFRELQDLAQAREREYAAASTAARDREIARLTLEWDSRLETMLMSLDLEARRVSDLEQRLSEILNSRSWRLMAPYRAVGRRINHMRTRLRGST